MPPTIPSVFIRLARRLRNDSAGSHRSWRLKVKRNKNLARYFAVAAGIAALCGTSAFAETRHRDETRGDHNRSTHVERSDRGGSHEQQRSNENWNRDRVNTERNGSNWNHENRDNRNFD